MTNKRIKTKTTRLLFLDMLKLLSITYIFVYHFIRDIGELHQMIDLSDITNLFVKPNFNLGLIATTLFVIISGSSLAISHDKKNDLKLNFKSILSFYKNRAIRILIPYYVVYVAFYIYLALYNHVLKIFTNLSPIDYIWNIFAMDGYASIYGFNTAYLNVGEWFMGCIVICYLLFPILYYFNKKYKYITYVLMTIYIIITLSINKFTPNFNLSAFYQIYNFYMGIFLSNFIYIDKIDFKYHILFIIGIIISYISSPMSAYVLFINTYICVFIYIIFYHLEKYLQNNNIKTFLTYFSMISYEFFLVHHFVISQANFIINKTQVFGKEAIHIFVTDLLWVLSLSILFHIISTKIIKLIIKK